MQTSTKLVLKVMFVVTPDRPKSEFAVLTSKGITIDKDDINYHPIQTTTISYDIKTNTIKNYIIKTDELNL